VQAQSILAEIDSLRIAYRQETGQQEKIDLLNNISYSFRRIQPDSVMKYAEEALLRSREADYTKGMAEAYKNLGIAHYKLGTAGDTIINYYQRSIQLAELIDDHYTQAACYNNIALVRIYNLAYNEAIQSLLKALNFYEENQMPEDRLKALILGNLGSVFHAQDDYERAVAYFEEALQVGKNLKNPSIASIFADEVANVRLKSGKIAEAYQEVLAVMNMIDEMDDLESKSSILITLANIECELSKYESAEKHATQALKIAEQQNFTRKKIQSLSVLSRTDEAGGRYDQAISFSQQALSISRQAEMYLYEAQALLQLSNLFDKKSDQETALYYLRQYNEVHERNRDRENQELTARLEADYQAKAKQSQIELLQKEQAVQRNRLRFLCVFSISAFLLLLVGGGMLLLHWRTARAINEKNIRLARAEQKLHEQNHRLQEYIESNLQLENFAYLASHDLREPMRTIVSFSQLLRRSAGKKLDQRELEFLEFIQEGTKRIEMLVNGLLAYAKINNARMTIEKTNIRQIVDQVCLDLQRLIREQKAQINIRNLPETILSDPSGMYQVFQNLISNAIKYHQDDVPPIVTISYLREDTFHHFTISDNGIGIAPEFYERIFLLFKTLKNKSLSNSSGIGLTTCKKIVDRMGGRIWVDSEEHKGSSFHFILPVEPLVLNTEKRITEGELPVSVLD
jgi:signal transduction histidine kinase